MIRNVIFDMGKVLLDYDPLLACYRHARNWDTANELNKALFGTEDWWRLVDGGVLTDKEYAQEMQRKLDTPELGKLAAAVLDDWWIDSLYLKSGMDKLVKELLVRNVPLYLLSNVGYSFHQFSYKIPYIDQFKGIVLSCEEKLSKPDPALFRRVCERYGLTPQETLFVDDWEPNVAGAESIGMRGYCFADGDVNRLQEYLAGLFGWKV